MMKKLLWLITFSGLMLTMTFAQEGRVGWEDGILIFKSNDGQFQTRFDVRMFMDGAVYFENKNKDILSSGTDLRRARFAMKVKLWKDWRAEWDFNFSPYIKNEDKKDEPLEIKDMWLSYRGVDQMEIQLGQFKPPFSLEELTSSRMLTFLERAYPNEFAPDRRMGLGVSRWGSFWYASTAIFGENLSGLDKKSEDEGYGMAGRIALAPFRQEKRLFHLGGSVGYLTPLAPEDGVEQFIEFSVRPETKVSRVKFLESGNIVNVDHYLIYGLEGAAVWGPFSLQGEYMGTHITRSNDLAAIQFNGSYLFFSWFLTGESRQYDGTEGELSSPLPAHSIGAWELATRASFINLTDMDAPVMGGKAANYTLALNWYANANVRFMLNYVWVDHSEYATGGGKYIGNDDFSYIALRTLVNF